MTPDTRTRLAAAALELLVAGGPANVSIRKVAGIVGVTPMAVYRHFDGLEEMLSSVVEQRFRDLASQWATVPRSGPPRQLILEAMQELTRFAMDEPHTYDYLFLHPRSGSRRYPDDFGGDASPTFAILVNLLEKAAVEKAAVDEAAVGEAIAVSDSLEAAMSLTAVVHGLVAMYRGGRLHLDRDSFESLCQRSVERMLNGLT